MRVGRKHWIQMGTKFKVLVIDAESLLRDGLCALLDQESDLQVVGAIANHAALVELSLPVSPDLVILDTALAKRDGAATLAAIRNLWPRAGVLVLTCSRDPEAVESALGAGANAYLLKSDSRRELRTALHAIREGTRYVSPAVFDRGVNGNAPEHARARRQDADGLSEREREVMKRIAQGRRTREIARELSLSHKTIEKYRSNLMRKLGLKTATAVAAYAIANGYLDV